MNESLRMKRRRILLVDDEIGITRTLALYLEEVGGCEVRVESHGSRALVTAREFRPNLILMDMVMPDADGGTVAADIKADRVLHATPIVFLTALLSQRDTGDTLRRIEGYPFLAKPVDPDTVLAYIERYATD
jgi:CheY-like chemotaxis protein